MTEYDLDAIRNGEEKGLRGAELAVADLTGADLSDADLTGAHLRWADLGGVDLSDANLSGTRLFNVSEAEHEGSRRVDTPRAVRQQDGESTAGSRKPSCPETEDEGDDT